MHLHKQKLTKYFRGHYIIMVGVTNFKELGVTFSCSVFAAFFWELPKNFPHVCCSQSNFPQGQIQCIRHLVQDAMLSPM